MPQIAISTEVKHLTTLADYFAEFRSRLVNNEPDLDVEGLAWLGARITDTHKLARQAIYLLVRLADPQLSTTPGHSAALERLASVVQHASTAGHELATGLAAFPFDTASHHPKSDGNRRENNARRAIRTALINAARTLDLGATACRAVGTSLARAGAQQTAVPEATTSEKAPAIADDTAPPPRTTRSAPASGAVKLSPAQQAALVAIAAGGVRMYQFRTSSPMRVHAPSDLRISRSTYDVLEKGGLIVRDTSSSLNHGQPIHLTAAGRATLPPTPAPAASAPATAVPPAPRRR